VGVEVVVVEERINPLNLLLVKLDTPVICAGNWVTTQINVQDWLMRSRPSHLHPLLLNRKDKAIMSTSLRSMS
jgi:hypothetical protein